MSIAYDLPGCMSNTQELDDSRDVSRPACEATSRLKRISTSHSPSLRHSAIALAISVALLASAVIPQAQQKATTVEPATVTYAVRGTPKTSIAATSSDAVQGEVDLALAQPQTRPLSSNGTTAVWLNLRTGPSLGYWIITTLAPGTQVAILGQRNGWYNVRTPFGTIGWVYGVYLRVGRTSASSAPASSATASGAAAQVALRYVGFPYAYGAAGPYAFDCSGLTQFVYRQVGVNLPRTASAQFNGAYGQIIGSMSQLQPGDLVFFAGTYAAPGITHAAIYVGNGRMVSAGTPWTGVTIEYIYASYWTSKWVGGLRPYR